VPEARPVKAAPPVQVIPVLYDLIVWSAPKLAQFPRVHRFTLGDRVMQTQLAVLDALIAAQYDPAERQGQLRRANLTLERLRYLYRLCRDVNCLALKEYEFAALQLVDTGRMVGGWLRHITTRTATAGPARDEPAV
jgi:hypothetical protein